jgi:hypothetical protein
MTLETSFHLFNLTTDPLLSTELLVFFSSLDNSLKRFCLLARKLLAIKTDVHIMLLAAITNAERRSPAATFAVSFADKPRIRVREEIESLTKLSIIEILDSIRHPVMKPVPLSQFGENRSSLPKRSVMHGSRTSTTKRSAIRYQLFVFHTLSSFLSPIAAKYATHSVQSFTAR